MGRWKQFVKGFGALAFLVAAAACGYVAVTHITDRDQLSLVIQMVLMCAFFSVAAALVIFSRTACAKNLLSGKTLASKLMFFAMISIWLVQVVMIIVSGPA